MKTIKEVIMYIVGLIVVCAFVYGLYYVGKTVSYSIFYEDMVEQTIQEQVQKKCLK